VNYTVGGTATLGTDYTGIAATPATKSVSFAAGSATATVTVNPTADSALEDDETVALTLAAGSGYTVGTTAAVVGTIRDARVILSVSPLSVQEDGASNLVYSFSRSGDTTNPLSVNYTVGGTASLGTDYTGIPLVGTTKTVTIAAGSTSATVTVDPTADSTIELDETVALSLAAGSGYAIGTTGAVSGTIINDDFPAITLAVSPAAVPENGSGSLVYTLNFSVTGSAAFGSDYSQTGASTFSSASGQVTFAAGASTTTITLTANADNLVEPDETVGLTLSAGSGYQIGTAAPVVGTFTSLPGQLIRTPLAASYTGNTHQEVRNLYAFAALKSDGSVITWGNSSSGGNSSSVASQLRSKVTQGMAPSSPGVTPAGAATALGWSASSARVSHALPPRGGHLPP
jgi:hypothetical protein